MAMENHPVSEKATQAELQKVKLTHVTTDFTGHEFLPPTRRLHSGKPGLVSGPLPAEAGGISGSGLDGLCYL